MEIYGTWKQKDGIEIVEVSFDGGAHGYEVWIDNHFVVMIPAGSPEQSDEMRDALNKGEDVRDWECGNGNSVGTLVENMLTRVK